VPCGQCYDNDNDRLSKHTLDDTQFSTSKRRRLLTKRLLLSCCLLSGLGDFAGLFSLVDGLDDTDSDGLTHVAGGETTERWVVGEGFDAHGLGGDHLDDSGITGFDEFGCVFDPGQVSSVTEHGWQGGLLLAGTTVNLLKELSELAGNVSGVAIQDGSVTSANLTRVVEDDDLGVERLTSLGRIVLGVAANVASTNFLDGNVLDVESNIVTWKTLD